MADHTVENGLDEDSEIAEAKKLLNVWRAKVEKADDEKSRLILEKLNEDGVKKKASDDLYDVMQQQEQCQKEFTKIMQGIKGEISILQKDNEDLKARLKRCQDELQLKRLEFAKLRQKHKVCVQIPDTKMKFTGESKEEGESDGQYIKGVFTITQRPTQLLRGGQVLITFEEEKVALQILSMPKCSVPCGTTKLNLKPKRMTLTPSVKFEVLLDISKKRLMFSGAQSAMPKEKTRDCLEMSFSRPSRGGGEVEEVEYDKNTGIGHVTFLNTGVAESLALSGTYRVDLDREVNVRVAHVYNYKMRKFQTFCGAAKRTVLLGSIDDMEAIEDEEDVQDHLEIYFQKPSNNGGEIENIKYISPDKKLHVFFNELTAKTAAE